MTIKGRNDNCGLQLDVDFDLDLGCHTQRRSADALAPHHRTTVAPHHCTITPAPITMSLLHVSSLGSNGCRQLRQTVATAPTVPTVG
ncbi:hypothetical protein ACLKA6_007496 [Drosophila palustris]